MDSEVLNKSRKLEVLEVEDEIQAKRLSIAEKKAIESKLKKEYGTLAKAKQILGFVKINRETLHSLYSSNPELRELSRPGSHIRRA